MVSVRHAPTDPGHGDRLPRLRAGSGPALDDQQEAFQHTEHSSGIQRWTGFTVFVYVL